MSPLLAPGRHVALAGEPWSDDRARESLAGLVADLEAAYRGPDLLWPNHLDDLEGDPDVPLRTLYLGAGGIVWALARLARSGRAETGIDLARLATRLVEDWRGAPEFTALYPGLQPSLLMGEAGLRMLAHALAPSPANADALAACVRANAQNPTRELLWGSPGTMLAASELAGPAAAEPWAGIWRDSAAWLLAEWRDELWTQDMYGKEARYVGAGHGFAGNVHALLRGGHLLEPAVREEVERRAAAVLERLARRDGACAQWPALLDRDLPPEQVRTQWCHGAPGMIIALGALLPAAEPVDELLVGGGELTWLAGPLAGSAGLCHGTAGNGYALLRLHARTGDERWLARARAFAMHAAAQVRAGASRYPLFSGAAGVALLLAACLDVDPRFPVLDGLVP